MRILFCNHEYPPLGGGGGVFNAFLAEELAKRHEVTVLTSGGRGLVREERRGRLRVLRVPTSIPRQRASAGIPWLAAYLLATRLAAARYVTASAYDVINTQFVLPAGPVGDALARHSGTPNVLTLHGGDLFDPSKWTSPHRHAVLRFWIRRLLRRATAVVAQSTDTIENVREFYDVSLPVERIPLGIRQPPAGVANRAAFGFEQSDSLLVTLGRLVPRKAIDRLIAIFKSMERPAARLLILGTGPEEPALRRQASMGGAAERIHFFGHVSEVDKFHILRMCDVFVSTSQHEGFGLTFLEAMICGLPVVCYDCGGQTDFLETGRTGFVLKLNDENAFLSACDALMRDGNLRSSFGATSRRHAVALTIEACARDYEVLFERARYRRTEAEITSGPSSLRPRTAGAATQSESEVRSPSPPSAAER